MRKAFRRIKYNISVFLETDVELLLPLEVHSRSDLIRMKAGGDFAEPGRKLLFGDVGRDTEIGVGISCALEVPVDFVDGEEEVCGVDGHEDLAAVLCVFGGAGLRLRITGADEDGVENCLSPSCCLCGISW